MNEKGINIKGSMPLITKNKKIVKNKTNGKFYIVEAFYHELYVCYELIAYSPKDYTSANGNPNVITDVVKQHFFDKSDLRYLNSNIFGVFKNIPVPPA